MRTSLVLLLSAILIVAPVLPAAAGSVIIDGEPLELDTPPIIVSGRTLVPLRAIFEALGADVDWDPATATVTATTGSTVIRLTVGDTTAYVNGEPVTLDVPALIVDDRTLVPTRFVAESLGAEVLWEPDAQQVKITSGTVVTVADDQLLADLEREIMALLNDPHPVPEYLLDTGSFSQSVATLWLSFTGFVTGTDLTTVYDQYYHAGLSYRDLATVALSRALRAVWDEDAEVAAEHLEAARLFRLQSYYAFDAAAEIYIGNFDAAWQLAEGIHKGSRAALRFGLHFVAPGQAAAVDYLLLAVDYATDRVLYGVDEANVNLATGLLLKLLTEEIRFDDLGGKTLIEHTTDTSAERILPLVQKLLAGEQTQLQVTQFLTGLVVTGQLAIADHLIEDLVAVLRDPLPGLTQDEPEAGPPAGDWLPLQELSATWGFDVHFSEARDSLIIQHPLGPMLELGRAGEGFRTEHQGVTVWTIVIDGRTCIDLDALRALGWMEGLEPLPSAPDSDEGLGPGDWVTIRQFSEELMLTVSSSADAVWVEHPGGGSVTLYQDGAGFTGTYGTVTLRMRYHEGALYVDLTGFRQIGWV